MPIHTPGPWIPGHVAALWFGFICGRLLQLATCSFFPKLLCLRRSTTSNDPIPARSFSQPTSNTNSNSNSNLLPWLSWSAENRDTVKV